MREYYGKHKPTINYNFLAVFSDELMDCRTNNEYAGPIQEMILKIVKS